MIVMVKYGRTGGRLSWRRWLSWRGLARWSAAVALAAAAASAVSAPAAAAVSGAGSLSRPVLTDQFLAVSCPVSRMCVAVGIAGLNGQQMLAERWNGSRWSVMNLAVPAGATGGGLTGVSCTSASACTAVGSYGTPSGGGPVAERWNGHSWAIQPTPSPGGGGIPFAGVSCASATSCTAVGYYDFGDVSFTDSTLVEHWDGTSWAIQPTPPAGDPGSDLTSVSCALASVCTAAGYFLGQSDEGPGSAPLAMRWHGASWAIQPTPGAGNATGNDTTGLAGVSCPATNACTAVGENPNGTPLVLRWDGTSWRSQAISGQFTKPPLTGVSCSSATACTAVGGVYAPSRGLAERWDGRTWSLQHLRLPAAASALAMTAVSCPSAATCTAVGFAATSHGPLTLAEHWNGRSWAVQTTQNPTPA
jgi:hypothetical protein